MFKGNDNLLPFICEMIPFPFPPSWLMSASFQFYEFKEGKKHSVYLVQRQVQTHMFYKPKRGGGFIPKRGSLNV